MLLDCENTAATFSQTAAFKGLAYDVEMCYIDYILVVKIGYPNIVTVSGLCYWFGLGSPVLRSSQYPN